MTWKIHPIKEFSGLAAPWNALVQRSGYPAFLESIFLLPLLKEFGRGDECLALLYGEDKQLQAGLILSRFGKGQWQTFQPAQLPLGAFVAYPRIFEDHLLVSLIKQLPGSALMLGLTQQDEQFQIRQANSTVRNTQDYIDTSWVDVSGEFDAYWDARGKNLKQNTKKQRNKLLAEGTPVTLECVTDPALVKQAMADYGALESAGWKAQDGTAIHPDNVQGRFYTQAFENFCAEGRGRIYRYRFGDKVVSMDLCIESGPVIIILKTAYDESYKSLSPSTLMRQDQFRQFFDEARYERIEFYGKVMEWHTRWLSGSRHIYHATAYRWPLLCSLHSHLKQRRQGAKTPVTANPL
jgi:hypothetical protein